MKFLSTRIVFFILLSVQVYGERYAELLLNGEAPNTLGVRNFYSFGMSDEYQDFYNQQFKESNKMRPLRNDESLLEYGLAYLQNHREMNDYEKAYNKLLKEKSFKEDSLEYAVAKGAAPGYIALGAYVAAPSVAVYAEAAVSSVGTGIVITTLKGEKYTVYDAAYDATLGVVTGKVFDKTRGKLVHFSKQVPKTDSGEIIKQISLVSKKEEKIAQNLFQGGLWVKQQIIADGVDTSIQEILRKTLVPPARIPKNKTDGRSDNKSNSSSENKKTNSHSEQKTGDNSQKKVNK